MRKNLIGKGCADLAILGPLLDKSDFEILTKYGGWLEALALKSISPSTSAQEHFVDVANLKELAPVSEYEIAWMNYSQARQLLVGIANDFIGRKSKYYELIEPFFNPEEKEILAKFGRWLDHLDSAVIDEMNDTQKRFWFVAKEMDAPTAKYEKAYIKYKDFLNKREKGMKKAADKRASVDPLTRCYESWDPINGPFRNE